MSGHYLPWKVRNCSPWSGSHNTWNKEQIWRTAMSLKQPVWVNFSPNVLSSLSSAHIVITASKKCIWEPNQTVISVYVSMATTKIDLLKSANLSVCLSFFLPSRMRRLRLQFTNRYLQMLYLRNKHSVNVIFVLDNVKVSIIGDSCFQQSNTQKAIRRTKDKRNSRL